MRYVKGMVQVRGTTYRIVRLAHGHYQVVRIMDDAMIGKFSSEPRFELHPAGVDVALFRQIAFAAIQGGKTSWVGRLTMA